jgi:ubiquinone/menaquinone biosynthesis C-methylase UbiE
MHIGRSRPTTSLQRPRDNCITTKLSIRDMLIPVRSKRMVRLPLRKPLMSVTGCRHSTCFRCSATIRTGPVEDKSTSRRFVAHYTQFRSKILFRWVDARKISLVNRAISGRRGLRILDLGCGTGKISQDHLGDQSVFGVDHDLEILTLARTRGLIGCQASFEPLPFRPCSFDVVLMIDSLEHVKSRERTAAEIKRVLRDDGCFIAITPCYSSCLWVIGEKLANLIMRTQHSGHVSPFTQESMRFFMCRYFRGNEIGTLNLGMWLYAIGWNCPTLVADKGGPDKD